MALRIYGASDDLIEIEGDLTGEFTPPETVEVTAIGISDGTLLTIEYTRSGTWDIVLVKQGRSVVVIHKNAGPDSDEYSDVAELSGDEKIVWVALADSWVEYVPSDRGR